MDALTKPVSRGTARLTFQAIKRHGGPVIVCCVAAIVALGLWRNYSAQWRQLWTDVVHDRNAHLEAGLAFASDFANGRPAELVRDIDRTRTWPPLHDVLLVGTSILAGGIDVRLAVLPDLAAYIAAALFAFLLARRLAGNMAGAVAAALLLASPAMRAYATDIMLEGPGACFTLAALYAAVRARQDDTCESWTALAASLSALFFIKYNYWLLVFLALIPLYLRFAPATIYRDMATIVRHPLMLLALLFAFAALGLRFLNRGNLLIVSAAWWALAARMILWIRTPRGRALLADRRFGPLVRWHAAPAGLWLAWPGKMSSFLWVLWPGSNVGEFPAADRWGGFAYYAHAIAVDYHIAIWNAALVGVLILLAMVAWRTSRRPEWRIILGFLLLAALLTALHPNRKSRFLHSWIPVAWVAAGCGVTAVSRLRWPAAQPAGVALATLIVAVHMPALAQPPHAPSGGPRIERPSALELTDAYLPQLAHARQPAVLCNVPLKFLARWTYLDRYGRGQRVQTELDGFDATRISPENAAIFAHWLETTPCDAIVLVELPATSPWYVPVPGGAGLDQYAGLLRGQSNWLESFRKELPDRGGAAVSVWRRVPR